VLTPCPYRWKTPSNKSIEITKMAIDTCAWPVYEIEDGTNVTVNYKPRKKLPVTAWLQPQARFAHLFKAENNWIVKKIQEEVDEEWEFLLSQENKNRIN
jgi:pyruvate ferredoxin oxidoreductase beta subunit